MRSPLDYNSPRSIVTRSHCRPLSPTQYHPRPHPQLPWWLLVSFGSYSLMSLGLGLLRFHDTPEAYESLLREVAQAKNELRDQGVEVD